MFAIPRVQKFLEDSEIVMLASTSHTYQDTICTLYLQRWPAMLEKDCFRYEKLCIWNCRINPVRGFFGIKGFQELGKGVLLMIELLARHCLCCGQRKMYVQVIDRLCENCLRKNRIPVAQKIHLSQSDKMFYSIKKIFLYSGKDLHFKYEFHGPSTIIVRKSFPKLPVAYCRIIADYVTPTDFFVMLIEKQWIVYPRELFEKYCPEWRNLLVRKPEKICSARFVFGGYQHFIEFRNKEKSCCIC